MDVFYSNAGTIVFRFHSLPGNASVFHATRVSVPRAGNEGSTSLPFERNKPKSFSSFLWNTPGSLQTRLLHVSTAASSALGSGIRRVTLCDPLI